MRVERNSSRPATPAASRVQGKRQKADPCPPQPRESWDGQTVADREASSPQQVREPAACFPAIEEGLTKDFLRSRTASSPTTLLAPCLEPAPFTLIDFPATSQATDRSTAYAQNLADHTKALYQHFFSDCYLELKLLVRFQDSETNNAGYEWVQGQSRLTLQTRLESEAEPHKQKTRGTLDKKSLLRRGVSDLISFVHEYAHATYDALLGVPAATDVNCANRSFSEGFAVLFELLTIDRLLELPEGQRLKGDEEDLKLRRQQRVAWLQKVLESEPLSVAHLAYAEGTELMAQLHRAGGLTRVLSFVKAVNPNKANALSRNHPDYRAAVGDPIRMGKLNTVTS